MGKLLEMLTSQIFSVVAPYGHLLLHLSPPLSLSTRARPPASLPPSCSSSAVLPSSCSSPAVLPPRGLSSRRPSRGAKASGDPLPPSSFSTFSFSDIGPPRFCTTGLPSDITMEVGEISFHLHKFPLLFKSSLLEKLIKEKSNVEHCVISLRDIPGGEKSFELVTKFCYGVKLEQTASNVVYLHCAAEHLQMTKEIAEGNLISQYEIFLNQVVLHSWKDSIKALQTCGKLLPFDEDLHIMKRCIESLAVKACTAIIES